MERGRSDELYRVLFDQVDNMVCTLDLEGRFTSVNAAGERLTGFSADELTGRFAVELIAPEHRDQAVSQFQRRLESNGELPSDESVLLTRDGTPIPIEICSALLEEDGKPSAVVGLVRDLRERRNAEEALLESDQRFRSAFESAAVGNAVVGLDSRFLQVNDALCKLVGRSAEELCEMTWQDITHPDDLDADCEPVRQMLAGEIRTYQVEKRYVHRLEHDVWALVTVSLVRGLDGKPLHIISQIQDVSERKRAEEALLESEQRFRSAFEFAPIGMTLVSPEGRFLQVNDSLCEIVGYSADELLEKTFQEITHPDDLEADLAFVEQMLAGEIRSYQMEKRYFHRSGYIVWVLLGVSLVRAPDGTPLHFISQIQDITERKRAEDELASSEARLEEAQRIAQIGDWRREGLDQPLAWSEETYRIFGIDPEEGPPSYERLLKVVHPDDRDEFDRVVKSCRATGNPYTHEYRVVPPNGSVRWVQGRGELVHEAGVEVTRGTAQDITERKAAEQRLAEAEERYRTLVEQVPIGMYTRPLDLSQPNIYASPQVEPLLGYPAEAWMTDADLLRKIVHPDDQARVVSAAKHVRKTGEPLHDEYRYVKPDGSIVWVQDETYVVCDEDGEPRFVQGYLLDITERKRAEEERDRLREELHHSQKLEAVGRLAGGVAHDFNNMLTAIKGYTELLLSGLPSDSPLRAEAEQIHRATEQASALPRQLLAFSRKQVLEARLVDLNDVVAEATDLIKLLLGDKIDLATSPSARPSAVVADPGQVEQVLVNLATNARDAMPDGGTLTIATRNVDVDERFAYEHEAEQGRYVVVTVSDTGLGMDEETLGRAFEPFFTTKGAGKGSGLGLASAYGITRQSGGFIDAESAPGKGSTFDVYFPLAVAGAVPVENGRVTENGAAARKTATVLLVEDEEIVRGFASKALENAGYRVLTASDGAEAIEICERGDVKVDALVSDMLMPGMGGRELAERVLANRPSTGVVLMSGYTDEPAGGDLPGGQVPAFLQKPFSVSALVDAVRDAIDVPVAGGFPGPTLRDRGITCLVADDHPAVLDSVSRFLEASGIEVVARAARGDEAIAAIETHRPAIALLDVSMEPINGIEVCRRAAGVAPETRVILYTGHRDTELLEQALDAGARGFVLKEAPLSEVTRAMKAVAGGGTFVDGELSGALATPRAVSTLSPLTAREQQVLALVADGKTNERVAEELGISAETVQSHVRNAMSKLEADTRTQAVATALRQRLIA